MPKTKQKTENPQTARIRQRLEEVKRLAAKSAAEKEIEINVTEGVEAAPVKAAAASVKTEEFTLDGASKFIWLLDGQRLVGQYRLGDSTIVINDPVSGYTSSMPTTLPLAVSVQGVGKLVELEKADVSMPRSFKLRSGELIASMAVPISLPRVVWRTTQRSIVWSIIQYQPIKSTWRVVRLRSAPRQAIYEAQQIMRALLGDVVYNKLKEAVELLSTPL